MNDENKENPNEHEEHENFEEDFEDFGLDDMPEQTDHDPLTDDAPTEASTQEQPSIERPNKKSGSFIPAVIGLAVLGFIGYKVYDKFIASPENQEPEATETVPLEQIPAPEPKPIEQPIAVAAPPPPPPPPAPEQNIAKQSEAEFAKLHAKIEQQEKLIKQEIDALEKEIQSSKQSSASTAQSVAAIQQSMSALSAAIQRLSSQMELIQSNQERDEIRRTQATENARSSSKSQSGKAKAEALPSLTIYAIIPGRAWLRTANGKTLSVAEGDPIEEYGRVLKIDASSGVVITTSGVTLR